jgi:hypothetical protein
VLNVSRLLFDIEGNGLRYGITRFWCGVVKDVDTGDMVRYTEGCGEGLICHLRSADSLIGHNIIGYDLPALWKLYGKWDSWPLITDTLLISRFLQPERAGGHGLEAWGTRLGFPKGDFHAWDKYTPEMLTYCENDVELNHKVLLQLEEEHGSTFQGFQVYK